MLMIVGHDLTVKTHNEPLHMYTFDTYHVLNNIGSSCYYQHSAIGV